MAVIVAIFSYFGIEMIAVAAGEARDPRRAITQAFRATAFRLILFYLLTLAVMLAIVPWNAAGSGSPFVKVMAATRVPGAAGVFNFVVLMAALSATNSQFYIASRIMFSLARAGQSPRFAGAVTRRGVPVAALLLSTLGVALAAALYLASPKAAFGMMLAISTFGGIFTWLMIFITHLFFRRHHARHTLAFRIWGYPYLTLTGAGLISAMLLTTAFTSEFRLTLLFGVPFLLLLAVAFYLQSRRTQRTKPAA